jgi:hypothetical protein
MRLISILYRRKMDTMRKIERYSWRRQRDLRNLCHIVEKVYLFNATIGFTTIRKYY